MDDDVEVRQKASKILSIDDELCVASHSIKIFLNRLERICEKNDFLALVLCLACGETEEEGENLDEFQVFEHSTGDMFNESFLIRQTCLEILKENSGKIDKNEVIQKCKEILGNSFNEIEILKLIEM